MRAVEAERAASLPNQARGQRGVVPLDAGGNWMNRRTRRIPRRRGQRDLGSTDPEAGNVERGRRRAPASGRPWRQGTWRGAKQNEDPNSGEAEPAAAAWHSCRRRRGRGNGRRRHSTTRPKQGRSTSSRTSMRWPGKSMEARRGRRRQAGPGRSEVRRQSLPGWSPVSCLLRRAGKTAQGRGSKQRGPSRGWGCSDEPCG